MGDFVIGLDDATVAAYRAAAEAKGRSLQAELLDVIERNRPLKPKDRKAVGRLARFHQSMSPPEGPDGGDSTAWIRWDRDTDHGRWIDDGWADHVAGR